MKKITTSILALSFAFAPALALAEEDAATAGTSAAATAATTTRPALLKERQEAFEQKRAALEEERAKRALDMAAKKNMRASTTAERQAAIAQKRAEKADDLVARAKERAGQEIERRMKNIEQAMERIEKMSRLSDSDRESLKASLAAQIASLSVLKSTITSTAATSTLKESISSITKSYRTYALMIPRSTITAAADRVLSVATQLEQFTTKLAERVTTASSTAADLPAAQAALTDMASKIAEARTSATAAVALVKDLAPDEGDKAKMAANMQAMKDAHAKIVDAQKSLAGARKDAGQVIAALRGSNATVSADATATSSAATN